MSRVNIERADGRVQSYNISRKNLSKKYYIGARPPYKKVYVKKELVFSDAKTIRLLTGQKRTVYSARKKMDALKFREEDKHGHSTFEKTLNQLKHETEGKKYTYAYVKATVKVTNAGGEVKNVDIVSQRYAPNVRHDMINSFRDTYNEQINKIAAYKDREDDSRVSDIKLIRIQVVYKPTGNGI